MLHGVLFDSGGTLIGPVGGRWNPRLDFEEVLLRHVPDAAVSRFEAAFAVGEEALVAGVVTPNRDDYHRVILAELRIEPSDQLLADLSAPLERPVVEVFLEVPRVLARLRELGVRMAIVTDNWGTAEGFLDRLSQLGLTGFDACVVSDEMGCTKPDPTMYRAASDALGLAPSECLFVDDVPALVEAAIRLGYHGAVICRDGRSHEGLPCLRSLDEVTDLVEAAH